jgi:hypothetical protein
MFIIKGEFIIKGVKRLLGAARAVNVESCVQIEEARKNNQWIAKMIKESTGVLFSFSDHRMELYRVEGPSGVRVIISEWAKSEDTRPLYLAATPIRHDRMVSD